MTDPQRHWDDVADRWWQWREVMGTATQPVSKRMVEMAGLMPGARVLDVASGYGEPAATAARVVGKSGLVVSTDLSREMSRRAACRAAELGNGAMRAVRMDGAAPAFSDATFHAVLCRWGLMALAERLVPTLAGLARLLVPDGRMVAAVWGDPAQVPCISVPMAAARQVVGMPPPVAGERGPFRLSGANTLPEAFAAAGLTDLCVEPVTVGYHFTSAHAFTEFCRATSSPVRSVLAWLPESRHDDVWAGVGMAAERMVDPDGEVRLQNTALCVSGRWRG
ncbi:MAG: class I SAM-dependent methyltransferase [Nitrospirota bacterium]|nr:class I SAM-dependent methyltransferase [Nitrospirota bacterium]